MRSIDFHSHIILLHHFTVHLLPMHLHLFLLQIITALWSLLQDCAFIWLKISVLTWSLSGISNASSESGVKFIFETAYEVLVGIWSLEGEVVHGSFEDVGLGESVLFIFVKVDVFHLEVVVGHAAELVYVVLTRLLDRFEIVFDYERTNSFFLHILQSLIDERKGLLTLTIRTN